MATRLFISNNVYTICWVTDTWCRCLNKIFLYSVAKIDTMFIICRILVKFHNCKWSNRHTRPRRKWVLEISSNCSNEIDTICEISLAYVKEAQYLDDVAVKGRMRWRRRGEKGADKIWRCPTPSTLISRKLQYKKYIVYMLSQKIMAP